MSIGDQLEFIAPMPRLLDDGSAWVEELRRLEEFGFDTVSVSHHVTSGWQLAPVAAMAFAAASTSRLKVLTLVAQNPLQHPALLAKNIATIDRLSGGRAELGLGAGWLAADYAALGVPFESHRTRVDQCAEALTIIRDFFTEDTVDFVGHHYHVTGLEALPRCCRQPSPPILLGAAGPRMLDLGGRSADIVGVLPRMVNGRIDHETVADVAAPSLHAKIARVRDSAARAGRQMPRIQFSVLHLDVTDVESPPRPVTQWEEALAAERNWPLHGTPACLVGTAAECAEQVAEYSHRFGIGYWHLGQDSRAAAAVIAHLH